MEETPSTGTVSHERCETCGAFLIETHGEYECPDCNQSRDDYIKRKLTEFQRLVDEKERIEREIDRLYAQIILTARGEEA
ncbi:MULTISPECIES: hypothetical protein [Halorussus]|uniref:hypothetical protein n=1 Tax=Halorussus TaxID=1070314 RepID=UPI00209D07F5|nr:hypothetical protein [Halorussus vallis]USZ74050.1 hypothetical protein NGM07_11345 [Halorussus vallis]